jgi:hypothetical protein
LKDPDYVVRIDETNKIFSIRAENAKDIVGARKLAMRYFTGAFGAVCIADKDSDTGFTTTINGLKRHVTVQFSTRISDPSQAQI